MSFTRSMGSGPIRALLLLAGLMAAGCSDQPDPAPASDADELTPSDSAVAAGTAPLLEVAQRHFDAVPDSVRLRAEACPFECCLYGEWRADSSIPLLAEPVDGALPVDTLHPGERFRAATGYVEVLGPAIVVVTDSVPDGLGAGDVFVPGDTMVVLDYIGEGFWNVWHDEEVREVAAFWGAEVGSPKGAYYGNYRRAWWVSAEAPRGRSGWFRADLDVQLSGVDACGTPL